MENLNYFIRSNPDNTSFNQFGLFHIIILILAIYVSYLIINNKKENRNFELFIGSILLIQQLTLYTWYFSKNYNLLSEGMPLYHCRISIILLSIGFILNKDILIKMGSYWGILGSIFALLIPGPDPFIYPHITLVSYFIGHMFLLWGSVYALFVKNIGMRRDELKQLLYFTNIYCVTMYILNFLIGSNYGYMRVSPIDIGKDLNTLLYGAIVIIISNIAMNVIYIGINKNLIDAIKKHKIENYSN